MHTVARKIFAHLSPESAPSASSNEIPGEEMADTVAPSSSSSLTDLNEIMEGKLATFYGDAIAAARARNYEVTFDLHEITESRVMRCEVLASTRRGMDMKGLVQLSWPLPMIGPIVVTRVPQPGMLFEPNAGDFTDGKIAEYMEKVKRGETDADEILAADDATLERMENLKHFTTVRIQVGMDCIETFCVKNKFTGEIVQGSMEPQKTTHSVSLEAAYTVKDFSLLDWEVVDIDDWLDGNEFWHDRAKKTDGNNDGDDGAAGTV